MLLHTAGGVKVLFNTGVGLITTVTFCILVQPFAVSVNTYTTFTGAVEVLIKVSEIVLVFPLPAALLIPATTALVQEKLVDAVALVAV